MFLALPDCPQDQRNKHWVQDAGFDGMVRWCSDWVEWRFAKSSDGGYQEHKVGSWRGEMNIDYLGYLNESVILHMICSFSIVIMES